MNLLEHAAKDLVLRKAAIPIPRGILCHTPAETAAAFQALGGGCVVKAQIPAGKRGDAGGIRFAETAARAAEIARAMFDEPVQEHRVDSVLIEEKVAIAKEYYVSVLADASARAPVVLFSEEGGSDIEELAASNPAAIRRAVVDLSRGVGEVEADALVGETPHAAALRPLLMKLFEAFRANDAELLEINPLAMLADGSAVALDCKFTLDAAAAYRQPELAKAAAPERMTALECSAREAGLTYIELEGNVALLANGAGLTMTTMDTVSTLGGQPANFQEIGGEAYTKAETALKVVLAKPGVRSLVVNFCGAFARTDVMAEGVVAAWETLKPDVPVFFSIHGTGDDKAIALVRERLGLEPFDVMEDAVHAAVEAAR